MDNIRATMDEAAATTRFAKRNASARASARFVGEVLEEEGVHRAHKADVQVRSLTLG